MSYPKFLEQLLETGTVSIETPDRPSEHEVEDGVKILQQFETVWRLEWAAVAPRFDPNVASWAGQSLYRACQLLVFRDLPVESPLVSDWSEGSDESDRSDLAGDKPTEHYNVDLTFRFLPQVWRFTQHEAENDPLTEIVRDWCFRWPLSSVGAVNLAGSDVFIAGSAETGSIETEPTADLASEPRFLISDFWSHPSLAQEYVDRIIEHKDRSRVEAGGPEIVERILAVAGDHLELFESIQSNLMIREPVKDEV